MELKAYEEIIDLPLFYQMKNLIIRMSETPERDDRTLFGCQETEQTMEEQYGLRYPGEVLERYEERCGSDTGKIRALALAVAQEKELLDQFMFTGSQLKDFMGRIRSLAETDLYLTGVLYLMTESEKECRRLLDQLLGYECSITQEAMFLIGILPENNWKYKSDLAVRFLGKERTLKAYGNIRLYSWFLENYYDEVRRSRSKSTQILKSLLNLSCKYIKEKTPAYLRLTENGYSRQEILYMNFLLPLETTLPDVLDKDSITMERMALDSCRELLNAEKIESGAIYELCQFQIDSYSYLKIKLEGEADIIGLLRDAIHLKNAETFRFLYQSKKRKLPESWFWVDIGSEETWDILAEWFPLEEYRHIFEQSLFNMKEPDVDAWLNKYRKLTGNEYPDQFWQSEEYLSQRIFRLMVQWKKYDLAELLRQYHADEQKLTKEQLNKKWNFMRKNMASAGRDLNSHEGFCFWAEVARIYGIDCLDSFWGSSHAVLSAVNICGNNVSGFSFSFPFLSPEEKKAVFHWVEQIVYKKIPEKYNEFLYWFLMNDSARKMFPVESEALFRLIRENENILDKPYKRYDLCKKYYSEDEWDAFQKMEKEKAEMQRRQDLQSRIDEMNACLQEAADASADNSEMYKKMMDIITGYSHYSDEQLNAGIAFFEKQIDEKGSCVNRKCMDAVLDSLHLFFCWRNLDWNIIKRILMKVEVVEDEPAKNYIA